jgi:toxin HigB-1
VIIRFRHKGLERLFASGDTRGVNAQYAKRLRRLLAALSTAASPLSMNIAGFQLHPLGGERKGEWAVSVSGNWRLVFRFDGEDATDVDLVDYH